VTDERLEEIRDAVARDTLCAEDAYADRAALLAEVDRLRGELDESRLQAMIGEKHFEDWEHEYNALLSKLRAYELADAYDVDAYWVLKFAGGHHRLPTPEELTTAASMSMYPSASKRLASHTWTAATPDTMPPQDQNNRAGWLVESPREPPYQHLGLPIINRYWVLEKRDGGRVWLREGKEVPIDGTRYAALPAEPDAANAGEEENET
jgi:hypothetical protein